MKTLIKAAGLSCLTGLLALSSGCTTQYGALVPKSVFIYPNSNVTPLGPVKAEKTKIWPFIVPSLTFKDLDGTYDKALAQAPGANLLINYNEDTSLTTILFIHILNYKIDGQAAKMEIGQKPL